MTGIADSEAALDEGRLLSQHQAALVLLQKMLANPNIERLSWLDLACGRGQILTQIEKNLNIRQRAKIEYFGYDLDVNYQRETKARANKLGFLSTSSEVGPLVRFTQVTGSSKFDFITLTNTIHELDPRHLAQGLLDALDCLSEDGSLFIYDMETLPRPELGAVPWRGKEMEAIVSTLLTELGATRYAESVAVGTWSHIKCNGWNVLIDMQYLVQEVPKWYATRNAAQTATADYINSVLQRRLDICTNALTTMTETGLETEGEENEKIQSLYEFWALSRAMRGSAS
ncbi:MAG TPA: class I SAM-dependent methyltransferase [Allosphingosinicella sp.]|jgi:SAM-dependent methyltransferase